MLLQKRNSWNRDASIRYIIFFYFTMIALAASLFIGGSLYTRMAGQMEQSIKEQNQILVNQASRSMDSYLRSIMKLSDSLYYGVIKNADLSQESVTDEMNLLYSNNKDNIVNIALFTREGEMLESVPAARLKPHADVTGESWFAYALDRTENMHFSNPHVQYVFDNGSGRYYWVISVSRAVEITNGSQTAQGILLTDINYSGLEQLFDGVDLANGGYLYLIDSEGTIIYHPKAQLIDAGVEMENNLAAAQYRDGSHGETFQDVERTVSVKTVGYTGWKIVGVTPNHITSFNAVKTRLLMVFIITLVLYILTIINSYISTRITEPIKQLERSVNEIEEGNLEAQVYVGGSYEIRHLGSSIQDMAGRIRRLMDDIVAEHESKRKSEFDTLQSQINPHFLYNTLDIIVWMIENEKQSEAVKAVTALARFFRISLSRGKSIIPVKDELEHVRNYLMIQHMRFKNRFTYEIVAEDEVLQCASLKLMLQPLVENAIYHGMEFMDGDGEIRVRAWKDGEHLYFSVSDNGLGMTEEQVERLFADSTHVPSKRGSGIGVKNVNERIKLYFGQDYGLTIQSEPDEGTTVTACLPVVPYESVQEGENKHVKA